ncbi:MAG: antitoxin family protein [Candidatus Brocadiaceae bacterium]|nr:antitoxin family protein [Candidatus Brocadiaceae bacterium]
MSKVIDAIFENGVFKPLQHVEVKEHEKVAIKIISLNDWQDRFNRIIGKIQKKSAQYTPEEIESDISRCIKETRIEKRGR